MALQMFFKELKMDLDCSLSNVKIVQDNAALPEVPNGRKILAEAKNQNAKDKWSSTKRNISDSNLEVPKRRSSNPRETIGNKTYSDCFLRMSTTNKQSSSTTRRSSSFSLPSPCNARWNTITTTTTTTTTTTSNSFDGEDSISNLNSSLSQLTFTPEPQRPAISSGLQLLAAQNKKSIDAALRVPMRFVSPLPVSRNQMSNNNSNNDSLSSITFTPTKMNISAIAMNAKIAASATPPAYPSRRESPLVIHSRIGVSSSNNNNNNNIPLIPRKQSTTPPNLPLSMRPPVGASKTSTKRPIIDRPSLLSVQ